MQTPQKAGSSAATSFAAHTLQKTFDWQVATNPSNTQLNIFLHGTPEAWAQAKLRLFPCTLNPDYHAPQKYY